MAPEAPLSVAAMKNGIHFNRVYKTEFVVLLYSCKAQKKGLKGRYIFLQN